MPVKTFTLYNLGRDLDNLAPGFGLTMDYDVLEGLIETMASDAPPDHLRDELRELAGEHHCRFEDLADNRIVHFVKTRH